ncbi:hypothetical protein AB434_0432 [Heyndrickxia coagulans]|uniref:Uncharacterized protein n=1 Tax=Heyndrickxia coagulans TaxID=1398 RepID=A0A0C5C831_HEYCO|nr:hypothetical protein SB48_HM08orf01149 [Heyndrickxia coagulans]AKN52837.1 hypothetical protein AB434_0432 [Heyndrickxia coagulans]KWZ86231.1 hypothetical protein HMPREF3213_00142 [Heyndrickxia coagulans]
MDVTDLSLWSFYKIMILQILQKNKRILRKIYRFLIHLLDSG